MNKIAIKERMKAQDINLTSWCRRRGLSYPVVYQMLSKHTSRVLETRKQVAVIDALIEAGLYIPEVDEGVSVDEAQAA